MRGAGEIRGLDAGINEIENGILFSRKTAGVGGCACGERRVCRPDLRFDRCASCALTGIGAFPSRLRTTSALARGATPLGLGSGGFADPR